MRELFVYYRVRDDHAEAALEKVRALHARLRDAHPALHVRLLRRPESVDGIQTWMEVYATDAALAPAGVGADLQADIEAQAAALLVLLESQRHTEVFIACAS